MSDRIIKCLCAKTVSDLHMLKQVPGNPDLFYVVHCDGTLLKRQNGRAFELTFRRANDWAKVLDDE